MVGFKLIVVLLSHIVACNTESFPIQLLAGWPGGLTGTVTIHTDKPLHGWKVHLIFENIYEHVAAEGFGRTTRINDHEWVIEPVNWDNLVLPQYPLNVIIEASMGHGFTATADHAGIYFLEGHSVRTTTEASSSTTPPPTFRPSTDSSATLKTITMAPSTTYRPPTTLIVSATSQKHT